MLVPTRAAAAQLGAGLGLTRDELYDHLHARLTDPPRRLSALERDVIAQASARAAVERTSVSFRLRPGLVAELLRFYDQLRRQSQQVDRFEELMAEALGAGDDEELDRGARRMRDQTRFLAEAFREYERRVSASDGCDEHQLRDRLMREPAASPVRHVVVSVADWIAEPDGLFVADFDLLSRLPGLEVLDIVCAEAVLASGFHERLHGWWPGIEETSATAIAATRPMLASPPIARGDEVWWTHRDREEELVTIARHLKADRRSGDAVTLERVAVVFKRPLPYLYLADEVFGAAGIPYQAADALPLAAEPTSAALDLVLEAVVSGFTRDALIALLRSPHLVFAHEGREPARHEIAALDRALSDARYLGDLARLEQFATEWPPANRALWALHAILEAARELVPLVEKDSASTHLNRLLTFWRAHLRSLADADPFARRERRARAALDGMLSALAAVYAAHGDQAWTIADLALSVRRWIEEQTFDRESGSRGIHLLDDRAARYGDFDDVTIVGVVEADWPERPRRNIFYPPGLLKSLGWPPEKDRRSASDARFVDLLAAAARRTTVSTFTLDDDALVSRSTQLDEVPRARLSSIPHGARPDARVFRDEALSLDPVSTAPLAAGALVWADSRIGRTAADEPRFHGVAGSPRPRSWSVSALETYLDCPFKFFAQHVLKLEEEPDDEEVMDPRRQGQFVHEVFAKFFSAWQHAGRAAITAENLDQARRLFTEVVDRSLESLSEVEGALERTRLLGSPAAAGLGEAVMRMEAERPAPVVERLLEHTLDGEFVVSTAAGPRVVSLRGKADRIDLLGDGTLRVIDYKLGWPPDRTRALQLPIYSLCAEQRLAKHDGRSWVVGEAAYVAFKGPKRVVRLFKDDAEKTRVLADAQQRLVETVDAIAAGQFPPTPDDVYRCETCTFASVCRKDYVGDV